MAVLNFIVSKVVSNLKVWRSYQPIVCETLNLFCDLSSGYSSGRFLLKLPSIRYMLENHSGPDFPFLEVCRRSCWGCSCSLSTVFACFCTLVFPNSFFVI